jgi:hypothetical protein
VPHFSAEKWHSLLPAGRGTTGDSCTTWPSILFIIRTETCRMHSREVLYNFVHTYTYLDNKTKENRWSNRWCGVCMCYLHGVGCVWSMDQDLRYISYNRILLSVVRIAMHPSGTVWYGKSKSWEWHCGEVVPGHACLHCPVHRRVQKQGRMGRATA